MQSRPARFFRDETVLGILARMTKQALKSSVFENVSSLGRFTTFPKLIVDFSTSWYSKRN